MNGIYCIKDGVCKLTKLSANGKDHIVKLVTKGELLGQRSMISDEPVNLSAVALEDMQVCFIPKSEVIHKKQSVFMNVMKSICGDLKEADDHMVNFGKKSQRKISRNAALSK
jgi:CRP-like cAMP-binding protein